LAYRNLIKGDRLLWSNKVNFELHSFCECIIHHFSLCSNINNVRSKITAAARNHHRTRWHLALPHSPIGGNFKKIIFVCARLSKTAREEEVQGISDIVSSNSWSLVICNNNSNNNNYYYHYFNIITFDNIK
jgi:hypothetical protein